MANYQHPSQLKPLLDELLNDPGHMATFDAYQADNIVGANHIKPVAGLESLQGVVPSQYTMAAQDRRPARMDLGGPTPKGNTKLDYFDVICELFGFAEGISKLRGKSLAQVFSDVTQWLRDSAGHQVMYEREQALMAILKGTGSAATRTGSTVENLATGTRYWDDYTNPAHDPVKNLLDLQRKTGATRLFLGSNIGHALMRSPIMIGDINKTYIPKSQLIENLRGLGFDDVIIGHQPTQNGPKEFPLALKYLHDGVAAMWSPGALKKYSFEPYQYDAFEDKDHRMDYVRALETCVFKSPYAEAVGVFTNALKP